MWLDHQSENRDTKNVWRLTTSTLVIAACSLFAATLAHSEVYKWADDDGIMHYSTTPPEKSKAKVKRIDSKDLAVSQASNPQPEAEQRPETQAAEALASRIDDLQRKVDAEHQARQQADAQNQATQAAYAQALAAQQAAPAVAYIPTIPTVSGVVFLPPSHRHRDDPCRSATAGTTAGCAHQGNVHEWNRSDHGKTLPVMRH